jgi:cell wall-associated NlpC family hydrolase
VIGAQGRVVAVANGPAFDYPIDGSLVHVARATTGAGGVALTNVSLLGGLVQVGEIVVRQSNDSVRLGGVAVAGRLVDPKPNTIVQIGPTGYLVLAQEAASNGRLGHVGLRLVLQQDVFGAAAGTEVLVGLLPDRVATRKAAFDPLAVLGFSGGDARSLGFVPPPAVGYGSIGRQAVAIAERFLGTPYVWGGADPLTGFDCSGLAMYVYRQLGVRLMHYTGAQFNEGVRLPREELEPGDLVFFDADLLRGPQHEGIYIGGGRFIHAPHSGDVVKISSLNEPRYGFSFVGAVRPYVGRER